MKELVEYLGHEYCINRLSIVMRYVSTPFISIRHIYSYYFPIDSAAYISYTWKDGIYQPMIINT